MSPHSASIKAETLHGLPSTTLPDNNNRIMLNERVITVNLPLEKYVILYFSVDV